MNQTHLEQETYVYLCILFDGLFKTGLPNRSPSGDQSLFLPHLLPPRSGVLFSNFLLRIRNVLFQIAPRGQSVSTDSTSANVIDQMFCLSKIIFDLNCFSYTYSVFRLQIVFFCNNMRGPLLSYGNLLTLI